MYLNWKSLTSRKYKIGLINSLIDRVWKICTLPEEWDMELKKIKSILTRNDHPLEIINNTLEKYIQKKNKPPLPIKEALATNEKKTRFIVLPFVHRKAEDLGRRLKRLVESNFELVKMNVAFKTSKTIGEMISFKDKVTKILEKSLVIYKIKCKQCKASVKLKEF